jgi:hypothetical protein
MPNRQLLLMDPDGHPMEDDLYGVDINRCNLLFYPARELWREY